MIHFVDNKGTIIKTIESPVYQGSAESNNIILIAPFAANLQFTVAFFLPNGEITPRYAMTQGGTLNGVEYAPTNGAMAIWTFSMPNNITQYFGTVYAQFYAYGTNGQITASSRTSFVVSKGVPEELPDSPDPTIYNQILTALSQINTALNSGSYAARAIYWWINTYTYGMNEITFYPIGTYGAFVRSTVTGNIGNQPYSNDGVLDSAHWQELVNFNKIYAAEQNAIAQAQAAAESAQDSAASASEAKQSEQAAANSANSIGQSEQNAAQSAQAAAESAQAAAESASKAEGVLQNAAMKNEAEIIRAPWDFDTQNGPIDFFFENKDSSCITIDGFSVAISDNNGDYIRTTRYQDDRITYQANETTTYTLEFPEKSGTLALTSDVAAEASERESADNALQSDIDDIQQQLSETQHFRGYYETTAQVQSISNPHSGDYAWNAQTGTVWNYSTSWSDSGVAIPDQTVPKSTTTPLMDGTATLGSTNTYADGAHRHPTDTTRASVTALNSETESRTSADNNLQSQIDDIKDGTTEVGRATNVTSQINGHAISDIFETDGTTVKEATQAQCAGYLAKNLQFSVGTAGGAWYKVAEVDVSSVWASNQNRSYSAFILLNTAHRTQNSGSSLGSGLIEFDVRKVTEDGVAKINEAETGTFLLAGNIQANRIATSISGWVVSLYVYFVYNYEAIDLTVVAESNEGYRCNYIKLSKSNTGTSAPSGAVYAVNRNFARPLFIANRTQAKTPTVNTDMTLDGGVSPDGSIIGDEVIFYCVYGIYTYTCVGKIKSISGNTPTVTITGIVSQANANDNAKTKRVKVYAFNSETDFCDIFIEFKTTNTTEVSDISTLGSQLTAAGYGQASSGTFAFAFGSCTNTKGRVCPVYGAYVVGPQVNAILVEPVEDGTGGFNTWNESDCTVEEIWLR